MQRQDAGSGGWLVWLAVAASSLLATAALLAFLGWATSGREAVLRERLPDVLKGRLSLTELCR